MFMNVKRRTILKQVTASSSSSSSSSSFCFLLCHAHPHRHPPRQGHGHGHRHRNLSHIRKALTTTCTRWNVRTLSGSSTASVNNSKNAKSTKNTKGEESEETSTKLWGGRFTGKVDPLMEKFNASISFDKRMWREDIQGSIAYADTLADAGILTREESGKIEVGLNEVHKEWENDTFKLKSSDEDIHTANERRLTELIGSEVAGKLHTGRSRNDQVVTDMRLWLRSNVEELEKEMRGLLSVATSRARNEVDVIMPGYTHLQPAQPIRFSHWLMAHAAAWHRDAERLHQLKQRINILPLGSGAIAGHSFFQPEHRQALAKKLGFAQVSSNSMDATSDRDFCIEFLFWAALTSVHLSRWSEDVILYSTNEFGFFGLSDAYSTGSSLMPQKKNPDACELLRGKTGRSLGSLVSVLTTMKGLPMTYNKDLQEDKEPLFDSVSTMKGCVPIATGVLSTLSLRPQNMKSKLSGEMLATDLADVLVREGVPFRETHHVAGQAVQLADSLGIGLTELTTEQVKSLHHGFSSDFDVAQVWDFEKSVESRNAEGSTSRRAVLEQCDKIEQWLLKK